MHASAVTLDLDATPPGALIVALELVGGALLWLLTSGEVLFTRTPWAIWERLVLGVCLGPTLKRKMTFPKRKRKEKPGDLGQFTDVLKNKDQIGTDLKDSSSILGIFFRGWFSNR
ncbi:hypothetical protein NDU88_001187 [Pleurodeles waltl]|uniref:Uncharacterized protein n=1 Tax=Pleurodeles waltl TaxID=8319 RepID=A0AAV7KPQ6_PLEWA|nr:hypothetical protein NDU88_001187 [Pleurodeles waltl]